MSSISKLLNNLIYKNKLPKATKLEEHKEISINDGKSMSLPFFDKYYISLTQRNGEQSIPSVSIGDAVLAGDIIATPASKMALCRHSPVTGKITGIIDITETHPSLMTTKAIEITADHNATQTTNQFPPIANYKEADKKELLDRIFYAGIAGMGGAGFPTEKKLDLKNPVSTLIINGAECEPYITCDDILMREKAIEILKGAEIIARVIGAKEILVGIESNKPEAISAMNLASETLNKELTDINISIKPLPAKYPMGSRHQIAHYLLGFETTVGRRSYSYDFICHNVATANACYDAVVNGIPLIKRLVTISGDAIVNPAVVEVLVGTRIVDIFSKYQLTTPDANIVIGGTMMGFEVKDIKSGNICLKREITSILAFYDKSNNQNKVEENCIRCNKCVEACPVNLLPQQIVYYGKSKDFKKAESNRIFDCIECGLCSYVCPSNISLVEYIQYAKGEILNENRIKYNSDIAKERFDFRNERLEKAKAEKEQKLAAKRARMAAKKKEAESIKNNPNSNESLTKNTDGDLIAEAIARTKAKTEKREKLKKEKKEII